MEGGGLRKKACARCQAQHRGCKKDCIFAPYFPADQAANYHTVHKVFSDEYVGKILQEQPVDERAAAVESMVYEANARAQDPVNGCFGEIKELKRQVQMLQSQPTAPIGEVGENQMIQSLPTAALTGEFQMRLMEEVEMLQVPRTDLQSDIRKLLERKMALEGEVQIIERQLTALTGGGEVQRLQSQFNYHNDVVGGLDVIMLEELRPNATQAPPA